MKTSGIRLRPTSTARLILMLVAGAVTVLSSCTAPTPVARPTTPATETATSVPASPTATSAPTLAYPFLPGTPPPSSPAVIDPQNAAAISEVARWGEVLGSSRYMRYTPAGDQIAISTTLGIYLYGSKTLKPAGFLASKAGAWEFDFSPDGATLAAIVGPQRKVELWSASDGSVKSDLGALEEPCLGLAFSPSGEVLATGSETGVKLWKVADWTSSLTIPFRQASQIVYSPDGARIYLASSLRRKIAAYDARTGSLVREYSGKYDESSFLPAFSADGKRLVVPEVVTGDLPAYALTVWNLVEGQRTQSIRLDDFVFPRGLAVAPDGSAALLLEGGSSSGVARMYPLDGAKSPYRLPLSPDTAGFTPVAFGPRGDVVAMLGEHMLTQWKLPSTPVNAELSLGHLYSVDLSPDGTTLLTQDYTEVVLWDVASGVPKKQGYLSNASIWGVSFNADGSALVATTWAYDFIYHYRSALIFVPRAGGTVQTLYGFVSEPFRLEPSPAGEWIAARGNEDGIYVMLSKNASVVGTIRGDRGADHATLTFSPDGQWMLAGNGTLKIVRTKGWIVLKKLDGIGAAFSADGKLLAYGAPDQSVQLLSVPGMEPQSSLSLPGGLASSIAFSPDGSLLAVGTDQGHLLLFDVASGKLILDTAAHSGAITQTFFTPDQRRLITASAGTGDGTVRIWQVAP